MILKTFQKSGITKHNEQKKHKQQPIINENKECIENESARRTTSEMVSNEVKTEWLNNEAMTDVVIMMMIIT